MSSRRSYTAEFKIRAIEYASKHGVGVTALKFDVGDRMIRRWRQDTERLKSCDKTKRAFRGKSAAHPEMEQELIQWVMEQKRQNRVVLVKQIQAKAAELCSHPGFAASSGWFALFAKRHGLVTRRNKTRTGSNKEPIQNESNLDVSNGPEDDDEEVDFTNLVLTDDIDPIDFANNLFALLNKIK
uniref:HTH CENPB-type domain-containing protein n=1 Tax=Caenorhabditis japonica TaxID=281687 RepID=A0A8R1DZU1_CAEJA